MTEFSENKELDIDIRLATIDDLAAIFHLGEDLFTASEVSNLYRTWDEYEVTGQFNSEPDYMLVATVGEKVVGFAIGTVIEKAGTAWNYGHLVWLGIEQAFARQGIASMLFDKFSEIMQEAGVRMLIVDTQKNNESAIRFFEKKGFSNPIDHVYMTLNFESMEEE